MWFPISWGLAATQIPIQLSQPPTMARKQKASFALKEGTEVLSPKDMLELPRPGQGVVNSAGDLILVPVSKFSFEEKKNHKYIFLSPIDSAVLPLEIPLTNGGDVFWLDSRTVGHVVSDKEKDVQELYAISVKYETEDSTAVLTTPDSPILVGKLPTSPSSPATNFIFNPASESLVFSSYVYDDFDLSTVKEKDKAYEERGNTALVYDSTFVRHWDVWQGIKKSSLFVVSLKSAKNGWELGDKVIAPLKGTPHATPVEPFGGKDDFDVSSTHVVYTAKDPELGEAWHTKQNIYITPLDGSSKPKELTSGKQGATHAPVFSNDGSKVAWLELLKDGYESDRAKIVIYDLKKDIRYTLTAHWDRSPDSLVFSPDDSELFLTVGDLARIKVFVIPVPETPSESSTDPKLDAKYKEPKQLTTSGAVSGLQPLKDGRLVFSKNSLTTPNDVYILESGSDRLSAGEVTERQLTRFAEKRLEGKKLTPGEDVWFEGAKGRKVQGWIVTPPGFKKGDTKKYPAVMLIHGGPQGAWEDQWSTRWNPQVWAHQGYIVFAPNPTGSTTFGQEFTDAIAEDWGGKPFADLQAGWKHVLQEYPEIDPERTVAAGASWGGYAINWIQGHPEFGFGFKALICHDGVFDSNYNGYSTDELFFFNHEWGGRPWDKKSKLLSEKMSPANFVENWSTPQLLIHGSKDYRLPETESIGAFHALQQKGIPSRLVVFPDENHWVLDHGNSIKWHYEVFRWIDEWVGDKN